MEPSEIPLPPMLPGFHILQWVGEGGMGEVYLARQLSLDRTVALKFLTLRSEADPEEPVRRFRREASLMARIQNPYIVAVHDHGELDGRPYLVMEYISGHDLRHFMEEGKPMAKERVRALVLPLTEALESLHRNDVLHRDFKPENILIDSNFVPKVTDFGIAVEFSTLRLTSTEGWMGTIGYVAPEVQYCLKVDARADQYSMAAVFYELLTGHTALGVIKPPSFYNKALSSRVDAVVLKALRDDRDERYPTIREFGEALHQALQERPPGPRRVPSRRITAGLAIVLAGFLVLSLLRDHGKPTVITNAIGMKLGEIPPGEFVMGSEAADPLGLPEEQPAHRVRFTRSFFMGVREVTVKEFRAFVEATGYRTEAERNGRGGHVFDPATNLAHQVQTYLWTTPTGSRTAEDDEPVTQVTWNDAVAFCRWLTGIDNHPYRLPTEAEWEYACRAGSSSPWFPGSDLRRVDEYAWTHRNSTITHPVGGRLPNRFGLQDMHGNVWEWCQDAYEPYRSEAVSDPVAAKGGPDRVLRGGSWDWPDVTSTRSAARLDAPPAYAHFTYGFRVVRESRERP